MSLKRLIFYSAMIGGWAAFVGWMICEIFLIRRGSPSGFWGFLVTLLTGALIGASICGGLTLLASVASGSLKGQFFRFFPGFLGGLIAGAASVLVPYLILLVWDAGFVKLLGWVILGLAIGAVEGFWDKSAKKLRNGLIGGGVGGFLGGLFFLWLGGGEHMPDRAIGFVVLGMCIGCFIGLAQVLLKEAWLTVEDGFRPGRQLVLNMPEVTMGTSEKSNLIFIAFGAKGVEPTHLRILRQENGAFVLQDNNTRTGTFLNGQKVDGVALLKDNDAIQLGPNVVRFREVTRHASDAQPQIATPRAAPAPPPPVPALATAVTAPAAQRPVAPPPLPPSGVTAKPAPKMAPPPPPPPAPKPAAIKPAAPAPMPAASAPAPAVSGPAPAAKGCPICGRVGNEVAGSKKRQCKSCGIVY